MENNFMLTDDVLWDYADGFLAGPEKVRVEAYLQQHPEWKARLETILTEKEDFFALSLESPDPGFADRVMAAWATEQVQAHARANGKDWIIRSIVFVFGLFVLIPLVVMVVGAFQLSPEQLPAVNIPEVPAVDWASWASNPILQYGLLLTLVFVGLRFLDKYLQHRRLVHEHSL